MGEIPDACTTVTLVLRTAAAAESSKSNRSRNMPAGFVTNSSFLAFPFLSCVMMLDFLSFPLLSFP